MKSTFSNPKKINKGAPSGFVISLIFHAVAFFVAGLFVVFTVLPKDKPKFEAPPPVDRPKMKLKKPKVKIKKSAQPKPSSRIVAKVKTAKMPEIQIPDLVGTGEGLLGGLEMGSGEFMDIPDIGDSVFGDTMSIGNDLTGTFYDFKRRRNGNMMSYGNPHTDSINIIRKFLDRGWDKSFLNKYYRSPRKLYSPTVVIAECPSIIGPMAFGEDSPGYHWGVLYEGNLESYKDIRFRFYGLGDNFLFVNVDGETVLGYWLDSLGSSYATSVLSEYTTRTEFGTAMTYGYGFNGKWIDLKAGEKKKLQVLIAESNGGMSSFMLCVEVDGVEYPLNPYRGGKTLPVFQTTVLTQTQVEELERVIYPGDATVNQGPFFMDFPPATNRVVRNSKSGAEEEPVRQEPADKMRVWTSIGGKTVKAELFSMMGDKAWLKTEDGQELKVPFEQLCDDDRLYLEMNDPPKLKMRFSYRTDQAPLPESIGGGAANVTIMDYFFGAEVQLESKRSYSHPLEVEYFAIGSELEGDHYVLLQRNSETFTPSKNNNYSLEFHGTPVRRVEAAVHKTSRIRGEKYKGYLVTVTDERGEIIQHIESNKFLFENLDKLKQLPVGRHFDKHCSRVSPPRPIDSDRQWAEFVFEWANR